MFVFFLLFDTSREYQKNKKKGFIYNERSWEEVVNNLSDKKTAKEALDDGAARVYDIMEKSGYYN